MFKKESQSKIKRDLNRKEGKSVSERLVGSNESSLTNFSVVTEVRLANTPGCSVYLSQSGEPLGFTSSSSDVIPSLYAIWSGVSVLPTIWIPEAVSSFVLGGAKLMLPGIIRRRVPFEAFSFDSGAVVCIQVAGNPLPLAVGRSLMSGSNIVMSPSEAKGQAVDILHYFGDSLWRFGSRAVPPGFSFDHVSPVASQLAQQVPQLQEDDEPVIKERTLSVEDMDALAIGSFFCVAKTISESTDLPMNASALYSRMQTASRTILGSKAARKRLGISKSGESKLDLRKSMWKSFSAFLSEALAAKNYVKTKSLRNEVIVTEVNSQHPDIQQFVVPQSEQAASGDQPEDQPLVKQWFRLNESWSRFFIHEKKEGSRKELNDLISEYLRTIKGGSVDLSDPQYSGLKNMVGPSMNSIPKKDLMTIFNNSLLSLYQISTEIPPRVRKGVPPQIKLETRRVGGNKLCTTIAGLCLYGGIDQEALAREMSRKFSVSCTVTDKGAIYCQGDLTSQLVQYLEHGVGVPRDCITAPERPSKR